MIPTSAEIAKHRLIHILKIDRLEIEMNQKKKKELSPSKFRSQLKEMRMLLIEDMYEYVFSCLPIKASKERLINDLVEEYTLRLNRLNHRQ